MSGLPPLPGHPGAVRLLADRLGSTARRLSALAAVLARLREGAVWEGPAGEAFGVRLREVAPVLDAVAVRLGGAAAPLHGLADAMEEAQAVVAVAVLDVDEAGHVYAALEDRVVTALSAGATEGDAAVLVLRHLQVEQVAAQQAARARHAAAAERFREADRRCAALLRTLSVDGIADALPYRVVAGVSTVGHDVGSLGALATVVPELAPVAAVADGAAVAADAALLAGYGEGDPGELAGSAALATTGALGGVLRAGASAGARRTATGAVSTVRLTARQRLALGAVREARRRRDALRASFRVPPPRGTPSALLGGPAARSPVLAGTGLSVSAVTRRLVVTGRRATDATRLAVRVKVDRAFLDDWRLATANGPLAQRMYVAGTTLEVAARAGGSSGARPADPAITEPGLTDSARADVAPATRPPR